MRSCAGRGALGGARRGRGAACGRGCPAKGLDGAGDGEALNGPLVQGLLPSVIPHPPKMDSHWGMHSNLLPERCSFTRPFSSQWRKHSSQWDPRIKAPHGPVKTLACIKSTAPIGSGMGDRGFTGWGFHFHAPSCGLTQSTQATPGQVQILQTHHHHRHHHHPSWFCVCAS